MAHRVAEYISSQERRRKIKNIVEWIIVWAVVIAFIGILVWGGITFLDLINYSPSACTFSPKSQACIDQRIQDCLLTESYSRDECIRLVSTK